jgi:hypothetical protein
MPPSVRLVGGLVNLRMTVRRKFKVAHYQKVRCIDLPTARSAELIGALEKRQERLCAIVPNSTELMTPE